ncbi:hypothetical protein BC829DRAFT_132164 [Chytridium lagenaria]|nr:hypothetical protein BC829DRAFT_132164 [Chytridium lagenaria]
MHALLYDNVVRARGHPRANAIPQGIPIELIHSILFGLVLTDPWNHPDSCFVPDRGFVFTSLPVSDHKASLREGDGLVQALLMSMAVYEPNPIAFLTARKSYHRCSQIVLRKFGDDEGYLVGLQAPETETSSSSQHHPDQRRDRRLPGGKAYISFIGSKDWKHVSEALSFLPGNLNGMPTLSNLGCHSGYLGVAEQIPDLIGALQQLGYRDIILCGHSRGGALAHLVLLLHLYRNDIRDDPASDALVEAPWATGALNESSSPSNSVKAYAFGSPFVVNDAVSSFLAERHLHHRFLSIVNDGDVIPGAMSTLGGLSAADLSALGGKAAAPWVGVDVDGVLRSIGPLIGAATGYPIPAALTATVGGMMWNSFWTGFVSSPILTYKPIGKYVFLRKKYGSETRGRPGDYLTTPDVTTSLDSVLHHFQTMAREFANKMAGTTVADLHRHHSADSYLHGMKATFSVPPLHGSFWRVLRRTPTPNINVPGEWSNLTLNSYGAAPNSTPYLSVMEETGPVFAPDAISPSVSNIIGQQVLLPLPVNAAVGVPAPRKVKLDILGSNLDLVDMKEGILLERYFVDPVRFHSVVARTKDKMVVEVTIESGIEKLPGRNNTHGLLLFSSLYMERSLLFDVLRL